MKLDNKTKQKQLSQEQIKQLMDLMKNQKPVPKHKKYIQKGFEKFVNVIKATIAGMDNFIKFVIKKEDINRNDVIQTARGPILFGTYVIIIFVVFGGLWSVLAPLDSAAVAVGEVIPSMKKTSIHHQGGIIKNVYVKLGDKVKKGDKIIELEEVRAKSEFESALNNLRNFIANENRLLAERDMLDSIEFDSFLTDDIDNKAVADLIKTETGLFESKKQAYNKKLESLEQRKKQQLKQLQGSQAALKSAIKTKEVRENQLNSFRKLYESDNLPRLKFLEAEQQFEEANSAVLRTEADIARIEQAILQEDAEKLTFINQYKTDIAKELNDVQTRKNSAREQYLNTKDNFDRIIVKSTIDGTVIELYQNSIGALVSPNIPIVDILPDNDKLIVQAKIPNRNIDSVQVGLKSKIRFSAFKSRTTPVFNGVVVSLSPDIIVDKTQQPDPMGPYYIAKIEIDMNDFNKVAKKYNLELRAGMQAEVQIVTGTRTLLQYLLAPVTDNMFKAFVEK